VASRSRRSNGHPGAFEDAQEKAQYAPPELKHDLDNLGGSWAYNEDTQVLLACMRDFGNSQEWRRQFEKGDVFDVQALKQANLEDQGPFADRRLVYAARPEVPWEAEAGSCVSLCERVASSPHAMSRDVELAKKYASLCRGTQADAAVAVAAGRHRDTLAAVDIELKKAVAAGVEGRSFDLRAALERASHALKPLGETPEAEQVRSQIGKIEDTHADLLARLDGYLAHPSVLALRMELAELRDERLEVIRQLTQVQRAMLSTGPSTTHYVYRGGQSSSAGNPELHQQYRQNEEYLFNRRGQLDAREKELKAQLQALQTKFGL
jgi:hypothetical protein